MSERNDLLVIEDILEMIEKIEFFIFEKSLQDFKDNEMCIDAVYLNLMQIGELVNRLTEEFKDAHPSVDWFKIRGLRNRIAHEYKTLDVELTYEIVQTQIKELKSYLEKIL